jgi:hypothetical protein
MYDARIMKVTSATFLLRESGGIDWKPILWTETVEITSDKLQEEERILSLMIL